MKIEAIPVVGLDGIKSGETQVIRLKVTGPIDPSNQVLQRARQLVRQTGSVSMAESFEWALATGAVMSKE